MKHNLHLLLGGVSDFKGQKLQLQCHCFSTAMICTNNEFVSTTFEQKVQSDWDLVGLVPVVTWWQTPALWVQPSSLVLAARPFHPSLQSGRGSFWSGSGVLGLVDSLEVILVCFSGISCCVTWWQSENYLEFSCLALAASLPPKIWFGSTQMILSLKLGFKYFSLQPVQFLWDLLCNEACQACLQVWISRFSLAPPLFSPVFRPPKISPQSLNYKVIYFYF